MKKITAIINKKTGIVTIKTEGYNGAECLEATRKLKAGLGMEDAPVTPTDEFYNTTTENQQEHL